MRHDDIVGALKHDQRIADLLVMEQRRALAVQGGGIRQWSQKRVVIVGFEFVCFLRQREHIADPVQTDPGLERSRVFA